jgi:hypothetical protein
MADPYEQLIIGGPNDRMTNRLRTQEIQSKAAKSKDFSNWKYKMEKQGWKIDRTNQAYKIVNGQYIEGPVYSYTPKKTPSEKPYDEFGQTRAESLKARAASGNLATWTPDPKTPSQEIKEERTKHSPKDYPYIKDLTDKNWTQYSWFTAKEMRDLNRSLSIDAVSAMQNKLKIKPTYETMSGQTTKEEPDVASYEYMAKQAAIEQEKGPASSSVQQNVKTQKASDYDKAWKFLQREGPGGRMTPQKIQAINTLDPTGTGGYHTRATRLFFGDKYKGTE